MKIALVFVTMIAATQATTYVYNAVSFCERYAAALFPTATPAVAQANLIGAVIGRALTGANTTTPVGGVVGILNQPLQMQYFNGTRNAINYYTNAAAKQTLVDHLVNFFEVAMNCRAVATTSVANMGTIHASLNINKEAWNQFVGEVVNTLISFGVVTTGLTGDLTYAGALLGQFNKGSSQPICTASDCDTYTDFKEFTSGTVDGAFAWIAGDTSTSVSIAVGGNVHWNIGSIHNVVQTDSNYAALSGGWSSGLPGAVNTYTRSFPTAGTYYFNCGVHPTAMRGTIVVGGSSGSGAASVSVSAFAVLASIAVGLSALKF